MIILLNLFWRFRFLLALSFSIYSVQHIVQKSFSVIVILFMQMFILYQLGILYVYIGIYTFVRYFELAYKITFKARYKIYLNRNEKLMN